MLLSALTTPSVALAQRTQPAGDPPVSRPARTTGTPALSQDNSLPAEGGEPPLSGLTPEENRPAQFNSRPPTGKSAHTNRRTWRQRLDLQEAFRSPMSRAPMVKRYAVGGEVQIDTSPVSGDPEGTIRKAQQIRAAANAPANPSIADRAVAAQAAQMEQIARQELLALQREQLRDQLEGGATASAPRTGQLFSLLA